MTIFELGALGEFAGAILLFISVIYVGMQIKQNTNATRAQIHQSRSDQAQQFFLHISGSDQLMELSAKFSIESSLDPSVLDTFPPLELHRYRILQTSNKQRIDNMFYQYEHGFLDEEMYEEYIVSAIRGFAPLWKELGLTTGRPAFTKEIERVLSE